MAKLKQPFLSITAVGTFAKRLTARRRGPDTLLGETPHIPDPRTYAQQQWRTMYQKAIALWHLLSAAEKSAWERQATPRHMTGYAYFLSQALKPNPGIYLPLAGGIMAGEINMASNLITTLPTPTLDHHAATKKYVDDAGAGLPAGVILMWSGTLANIPAGFVLCDGNNGTPNLLARFILSVPDASTNPGTTGGALTHTHPTHTGAGGHTHASGGSHRHDAHVRAYAAMGFDVNAVYNPLYHSYDGAHTHDAIANHTHNAHTAANHQPPYYTLAFIMKT